MELWIRSQDKMSLIKVNKVCFERNIDDEPTIYGYENYENYERLGIYKTKERALEVLDDIHNVLKGNVENHINKFDLYRDNNVIVYEMPKD